MRFNAREVRLQRVEGLSVDIQEFHTLRKIARVLHSSGLVHVDEEGRLFNMHQLLQQAVGRELGWKRHVEVMQALLHARCGHFDDETDFDTRLYGLMREVLGSAVDAVGRVKVEGGEREKEWCSGMLLRLHQLAIEVHGGSTEFSKSVIAAAHFSLVADLVQFYCAL
jgi:hypothetical protein